MFALEELAFSDTVGNTLLPGLIGQKGELLYDHLDKESRINKGKYKEYLYIVQKNVAHLYATSRIDLD